MLVAATLWALWVPTPSGACAHGSAGVRCCSRVFQQEFDFKTKYGLDLSEEQIVQLKKIFAIANLDHSGIIGRRQFSDLMFLLGIEPTHD